MRDGRPWVSDAAFVTRKDDNLLVEGWIGSRVVSILVRPSTRGSMPAVWEKLNELVIAS